MSKVSLILKLLAGLPKTIYLNFRVLPFNQAIHLPLFVSYNTTIDGCKKGSIVLDSSSIRFAMVSFGIFERSSGMIYPSKCYLCVDEQSNLIFRGSFAMSKGGCLKVTSGGNMVCGNRVTFNSHSKVLCTHDIKIGNNVRLGWDTMLKDGDGHAICDETGKVFNDNRPIIIGNDVWVGAEVSLLKGAVIPDGSVVGFRALVTKKFEQANVIIAGSPAKIVKENIRWIHD